MSNLHFKRLYETIVSLPEVNAFARPTFGISPFRRIRVALPRRSAPVQKLACAGGEVGQQCRQPVSAEQGKQ
jgi:hypothetical protein